MPTNNNRTNQGKRVASARPTRKGSSSSKGRGKKKQSNISPMKAIVLAIVILIFTVFANNDFDIDATIDDFVNLTFIDSFFDQASSITLSDDFYEHASYLAGLYPNGRDVYYLDVMTISASDWEYEVMMIGRHDHLGRTLPIVAHLSQRNLGRSDSRGSQSHQPTGWDQSRHVIDGSEVWVKNRGHLIAYTLSFNFNEFGEFSYGYLGSDDEPYNLFTQTAHSNQNVMTYYEGQIRNLLADGCEVVFMSAPIFRDLELMARGIWLQAASDCDDFALSVYIFNEQPGVLFDHSTGGNWVVQ